MGGFSLFVQDGKLRHTYSMMGVETYRQESTEPLPSGDVTVRMQFDADEPKPGTGGTVTLWANDRKIGEGRIDKTVPVRFSGYAGMDIGRDNGLPVDREAYGDKSPFPFTGSVKKVVFDLAPPRGSKTARRCTRLTTTWLSRTGSAHERRRSRGPGRCSSCGKGSPGRTGP